MDGLPALPWIDAGFDFGEAVQIVHPQADTTYGRHARQLPGQAPANTDIAKIIDDTAKNIEIDRGRGGGGIDHTGQAKPVCRGSGFA
ncbi:hypothetical protein GCM10027278_09790 [Paralcaligenes ginsengisoli]